MTEVEGADVSICTLERLDFAVEVWMSDVDKVESSDVTCEMDNEAVSTLRDALVAIDITDKGQWLHTLKDYMSL
jgi:hypothetical protein